MYRARSALQMKRRANQRRSLALYQRGGPILAEINKQMWGGEDKEEGMKYRRVPGAGFTRPSQETALS